jgi:hypothetical protein
MRTRALTAGAALAAITFAAGCGGSSSGSTTPPASTTTTPPATSPTTPATSAAPAAAPADVAAAKKDVKTAYLTVFNPKSTKAEKEGALEDGSTLGPTLKFAVGLAKTSGLALQAKIDKVAFTSSTAATVTYDLVGTPLKGSTGNAILVNGKWVVAKQTFCTLLNLGAAGKPVPGCS